MRMVMVGGRVGRNWKRKRKMEGNVMEEEKFEEWWHGCGKVASIYNWPESPCLRIWRSQVLT